MRSERRHAGRRAHDCMTLLPLLVPPTAGRLFLGGGWVRKDGTTARKKCRLLEPSVPPSLRPTQDSKDGLMRAWSKPLQTSNPEGNGEVQGPTLLLDALLRNLSRAKTKLCRQHAVVLSYIELVPCKLMDLGCSRMVPWGPGGAGVQVPGSKVQGPRSRVQGPRSRVQGPRSRVRSTHPLEAVVVNRLFFLRTG